MVRTILMALVDFMYWANYRVLDAAQRLPAGGFATPSDVTTRDLRSTLVHELDVEWSWRMSLEGRPESEWDSTVELKADDFPTVAALRARWQLDEAEMRAWLARMSDDVLLADVSPGLSRETRPLWQFLLHIVTHATQQQADAATLLTLAGQSPGNLDYGAFLEIGSPG